MLKQGQLMPILNTSGDRSVEYIAGPSGSGKSTIVADLVRRYLRLNPNKKAYLFSRSPQQDDPAFDGIDFLQVPLTTAIVTRPVNITTLEHGTVLVFDDVGTISDDKIKRAIEKIMMDAVEVGRKYGIFVIITSHLIVPTDKKFARTMMNEIQYLTIFPKSGTTQPITYALKTYFGLGKKEIERVLNVNSRWARIHARCPRFVMYDHGAYLL
jgi:hypothetical protein